MCWYGSVCHMLRDLGANSFLAQDDASDKHQQMAVHIYHFLSSSLSFSLRAKVMSAHKDIPSDLMCTTTFPPSALLIPLTFASHYSLTWILKRLGSVENIWLMNINELPESIIIKSIVPVLFLELDLTPKLCFIVRSGRSVSQTGCTHTYA